MALLFSFLIFIFSSQAVAAPEVTALPEVKTYDELLAAIREVRAAAQHRVEQAVKQEKVREAWETGRLIDRHVLLHKERADYGQQVILRLSADLDVGDRELYYMLEFYRAYPILLPGAELSWSHYKALLDVKDPREREDLTQQAVHKNWDRDRLREEIRRRRLAENPEETESSLPPLVPQKGRLDTYRIVTLEGRLQIALGLSNYLELSRENAKRFKEGDIVHVSNGKLELLKGATETLVPLQIFSYRARVLETTDGDTFWALVDLGFGITTKQHLRLRGLDAPEIETAEGKEAKAFLERQLKDAPEVVITSTKSDKYDRYLVDLWAGETFINQKLIDKDLAVTVRD